MVELESNWFYPKFHLNFLKALYVWIFESESDQDKRQLVEIFKAKLEADVGALKKVCSQPRMLDGETSRSEGEGWWGGWVSRKGTDILPDEYGYKGIILFDH